MKPNTRSLPFTLNRHLRIPLSTQLAENLRNAILSGYYKTGEILPSYKQLAKDLNVSLRIPREAMADLMSRDMVNPRPRIGCEVLPRKTRAWKGRILVTAPGDTFITYFAASLFGQFRKTMTERGWLVDLITFSRSEHGKSDFSMLDDALMRAYDFALLIYPTSAALNRIIASKTRFICFGNTGCRPNSDATISFSKAMGEALKHIMRKDARRTVLIEYKQFTEIHRLLRTAGISFDCLEAPWETGIGYLERISSKGYELTRQYLTSHRSRCQQLVFFTDDFIARGGLCAILEAGLRVPKDIEIITFSNRGFSPFTPIKISRIEADPFDLGNKIADEALRRISGLPPLKVCTVAQFLSRT